MLRAFVCGFLLCGTTVLGASLKATNILLSQPPLGPSPPTLSPSVPTTPSQPPSAPEYMRVLKPWVIPLAITLSIIALVGSIFLCISYILIRRGHAKMLDHIVVSGSTKLKQPPNAETGWGSRKKGTCTPAIISLASRSRQQSPPAELTGWDKVNLELKGAVKVVFGGGGVDESLSGQDLLSEEPAWGKKTGAAKASSSPV